jgi:hypothetical protein
MPTDFLGKRTGLRKPGLRRLGAPDQLGGAPARLGKRSLLGTRTTSDTMMTPRSTAPCSPTSSLRPRCRLRAAASSPGLQALLIR